MVSPIPACSRAWVPAGLGLGGRLSGLGASRVADGICGKCAHTGAQILAGGAFYVAFSKSS